MQTLSAAPINTGTFPNDGTGETIRSAFIKINSNFLALLNVLNATNILIYMEGAGDPNVGLQPQDSIGNIVLNGAALYRNTTTGSVFWWDVNSQSWQ